MNVTSIFTVALLSLNTAAASAGEVALLAAAEFGAGQMQCISSPTAPAGTVMYCEGKATKIPASAIGHEIKLPHPVRLYSHTRQGVTELIWLDGDELLSGGPGLRASTEAALRGLPICLADEAHELRVWRSPIGFVVATRVTVPAAFLSPNPEIEVLEHTRVSMLQFVRPSAGLECTKAAGES